MKKEIIGLLLLVLAVVPGCKKWLDVKPRTIVEESQLLTTEKGFEDAMYGVYTVMSNNSLYGDQLTMSFLDVLAQNYDCQTRPTHSFYQASIYNYADGGVKIRIMNIWDSMYNAITNVNNILLNIDGKKDVFTPGNYELVKGEALGLRAFMYFDLMRMFGGSYVNHASQAYIPYITTVSGGVTPLSSVNEVLDKVIKDLTDASGLLSGYKNIDPNYTQGEILQNDWLNSRQSHFNYWAAEATLARVYLYKGDKQHALEHALNVINSGMFKLETGDRLSAMNDRTFIPEQVFALSKFNLRPQVSAYFQTPSGTISTNVDMDRWLTNSYGNSGVVDQIYEITQGGVTDLRYARLWQLSGNVYFTSKYWQDGTSAQFANLVPLIRLPEMYYIAAECSDLATATGYLNTVREQRGLNDLSGLDDVTVQNEILKEYQKEFYAEGQMFYYYKRLNLSLIRFSGIPGSDNIYILPLPDGELQYRGK